MSSARGWSGGTGPSTTVLLLRHGQTALTPDRRFSGSGADPDLSPTGLIEAAAAARRLGTDACGVGVDAVLASPLRRATATAQACADRLGLPLTVEPGLRELDFGAWEGRTHAEVAAGWPSLLAAWKRDETVAPPNGESFAAMTRRVLEARDRLVERHHGRTVLVVSHVGPIKALVRDALDAPPSALFHLELSPASLTVIRYDPNGDASLRSFSDTCHLHPAP
ncbi:histidine phosphatase family protein [Streptacidiphilus jiangxiensis]|uniref:Probable phosphoglycerate mutase n=1 Tax=Streptacidiphilus jiangxiensis TaxID=235985 RepID=A0A1H7ZNA5_STRJI|nr:histidine phosphatase family protein [Streptacidiphilus jiangxiensis]SEM59753.1 probable phosphoglycerate mutase [Streptacidiphilus jiangxiensis]